MANYMNDPRETMVSENGIFLDWCGDDTRYYYNGSYVDLCGMSPEEYMKRWDCCDDNGGNSDTPKRNPIVLTQTPIINENTGMEAVEIVATASKPVATDITVNIMVEYIDESTNTIVSEEVAIVIPRGQKTGKFMFSRPSITITSAKPSPESDEQFDYVTEGNISEVIGCLFHGVYPTNGPDNGITVGLENIIKDVTYLNDKTYNATVMVPYVQVEGPLTDEVIDAHVMDMIFAIDADIDNFSVTDAFDSDYTKEINKVRTISVQAPDETGKLITAFYNVYRMKNDQLVNVGTKPNGSPVPFDIKIKIQ